MTSSVASSSKDRPTRPAPSSSSSSSELVTRYLSRTDLESSCGSSASGSFSVSFSVGSAVGASVSGSFSASVSVCDSVSGCAWVSWDSWLPVSSEGVSAPPFSAGSCWSAPPAGASPSVPSAGFCPLSPLAGSCVVFSCPDSPACPLSGWAAGASVSFSSADALESVAFTALESVAMVKSSLSPTTLNSELVASPITMVSLSSTTLYSTGLSPAFTV